MKRLALILALLLGGCAVGPNYRGAPDVTAATQPSFERAGLAGATAALPADQWWRQLNDGVLDGLVQTALARNRDLAVAEASLRASRAVLGERTADFLPSSQASAGYQRQRFSAQGQAFGNNFVLPDRDFYTIGIDSSWEIDLFGRLSRRRQEALADAGAAEATRNDVRVSIAAETVSAYLSLRGAQARLDVAQRAVENQASSLDLGRKLLAAGRGTKLDVSRAESLLADTQASMAPLAAEVDVAIHRLGVLTGASPSALRQQLEQPGPIPALPDTLDIGDPGALLSRRPDVRIAERGIAAAVARMGIARAEYFPRVSVAGNVGLQSNLAGELLTSSALAFAAGPQLVWNLLDWPRIRARIKAADANADAAAARYEATVLRALEETENALSRRARERQRLAALTTSRNAAVEAARLARLRYQNGVDAYLSVLDAERVALQSQDQLVASQVNLGQFGVAVYKALGAGWQPGAATEPPSPASP